MARVVPHFLQRYSGWILLGFALATPGLVYSAYRTIRSNANEIADWLPASYNETTQLDWFREHFPADQFIIVSWDGCRLGGDLSVPGAESDDPRIEQLAQLLVPSSDETVRQINGQEGGGDERSSTAQTFRARLEQLGVGQHFKSVTTGRRLLNRLTSPAMGLPYATAVERLQGALIGPDGHQTCLLVALDCEATSQFRAILGHGNGGLFRFRHQEGLLWQAMRECSIDVSTVRLGGPPVDNVAIDEEGERTMVRLAVLACLLGLVLSWWSLRSLTLTVIVFTCGILSSAAGLAAVWLSGTTADAVVLSMPTLIYILSISGAVHLINYYRDAIDEVGIQDAAQRAIAHGWKPALLCSVTTAFGLLSLCTSELTPVRKFGSFSALAMMLMLIVLFLFLPAALQKFPLRTVSRHSGSATDDSQGISLLTWGAFWDRFGSWIIRHHASVTTVSFLIIATVGWGVTRVHTTVDLMKFFRGRARILEDYQWLEANIGRLVPMEVVLCFNSQAIRRETRATAHDQRLSLLERHDLVAQVQEAIQTRFGPDGQDVIGPPLSAVSFLPGLPAKQRGMSTVVRRTVANSRLQNSYPALCDSGYLRADPQTGDELWRISLRVAAFRGVDYGRFSDEVQEVVDPLIAAENASSDHPGTRLSAVYTGVVPIVYKAQRALLNSLISSTVWSFLTITPLLMFVSRGVRAGIVAMLPNALPVLVVFGGMGWLGISVDIGSMMSASIALGVAVDDTIHYLTWFREDLNRTGNHHEAILGAYRRCAAPTLQAGLISGLGLSVFVFSTFNPTKQLGYLMLTILLAGVIAELVLLPALLGGPLGKAFQPARRSRTPALPAVPESQLAGTELLDAVGDLKSV